MNRDEIMTILPHRGNMLLVDEVNQVDGTACGLYHVRGDEFFLDGHFPGKSVVPGVILCEILAQSCCVLLADVMKEGKLPLYAGLKEVKFRSPVKPGDDFITKCRIIKARPPFYFAEGEGYVDDRLCVKAEFSFAVMGD